MERASPEEAIIDLVIGQAGFSTDKYDELYEKIRKMTKAERMKLAKQEPYPKTWTELFENKKTEWYKAELPPNTEFVNKIFDSGKGFMTYIGQKHTDLVKDYISKKMPAEQRRIIDGIRKNLTNHPRIIVLTKDFEEYSIFDGARRAVAFTVEKKNIPVYIGKRDSFSSLPYLR